MPAILIVCYGNWLEFGGSCFYVFSFYGKECTCIRSYVIITAGCYPFRTCRQINCNSSPCYEYAESVSCLLSSNLIFHSKRYVIISCFWWYIIYVLILLRSTYCYRLKIPSVQFRLFRYSYTVYSVIIPEHQLE